MSKQVTNIVRQKQEPAKRFRYYMIFKPRTAELTSAKNSYTSRFGFGDTVVVYFGTAGILKNCRVIKTHFTEDKVFYDVEVKWNHLESADLMSRGIDAEREITDRLYNLDSGIVFSPNDFEKIEPYRESSFVIKLKAHVDGCMKKSGMDKIVLSKFSYDERKQMMADFFDSLEDGAVDALGVSDCVQKYIPQPTKNS